jgi:trigger factor
MKVSASDINSVQRKVRVDFEWNEVDANYTKTLQKLRKELKVDGFRPGKVPVTVAKRLLGSRLNYDFTNDVIETTYKNILKENGFNSFIDLEINEADYKEGESFFYEMVVEIDPEVKLPNYKKGFQVPKTTYIVDEEDVNLYLEDIREHYAEVREVDEGARSGDFIICDMQETDKDGMPLIGRKVQDRMIKVGEGIFGEPGSTALIGTKAGDKVRINITSEEGKQVHYLINVKRVESHDLPELTDKFIKENFDKYDDLKALKEEVEKSITAEWENRSEKDFLKAIRDYFIKNATFEVPESRVKRFLDNIVEDIKAKNGNKEIDEQKLREQYRPMAEREIRWYLIQEAIDETEKIEVSNEEIEKRIAEIAGQYPEQNRDAVARYYRKAENRSHLESDLREQKIFDYLKQFVKIKKETLHTAEFRKRNM